MEDNSEPEKDMTVTDPVCGMRLTLDSVAAQEEHGGWAYFFCSQSCHARFLTAPERYSPRTARFSLVSPDVTS